MRDRSMGILPAFLLVFFVGCQSTPAITVVRSSAGDKTEDVKGDPVKLKRGPQEAYAGARGGYYVVRSTEDWQHAWPGQSAPPVPPTLDTARQMLFLGVAENGEVTKVKLSRSIETGSMLYVWATETRQGEQCHGREKERPFDAVVTQRLDKPVKFFVTEERAESCGDPPVATVSCRLKGKDAWAPKLNAQTGDSIECEMTATATGKFELVDKILSIEPPPGSAAKLSFKQGPTRGESTLDVYGSYTVHAEATDEGGRHGMAVATIDVKPPKTKDVLVQLVWTGFQAKDESDSFPRVNLRVSEEGAKGRRCSGEIPVPGLCAVTTRGAYTYMRIPESNRKLPVSVQYMDERVEKGPAPCVHVWYDGERVAETCDRRHREADEIWKVGTLDTTTGNLSDGDSQPTAARTPASALDAGR